MLLSGDLIKDFLNNRKNLLCHKGGDIAMAIWIEHLEKSKKITWFPDNARIVHHPPVATYIKAFSKRKEICHSFISIHGVYGKETHTLQNILQREKASMSSNYVVPPIVNRCPKTIFRWQNFGPPYRAQPRPCSKFPLWSTYKTYPGRTGGKYRRSIF